MKLFIIGQVKGVSWEFVGVVDNEDSAISACINRTYFCGPVTLGEILPDKSVKWEGAYYPNPDIAEA